MEMLLGGNPNALLDAALARLASRRSVLSGDSVRQQVFSRIRNAYIGDAMKSFGEEISGESFRSAPLLNPPIVTGMTETLQRIYDALMKRGGLSTDELKEVPGLFRRMRQLLRVYYNAKLTGKKTPDFKFCDIQKISDIGLQLHEVGLFLQLNPPRLRALLDTAPDMEIFLLDEPVDVGKFRKIMGQCEEYLHSDVEIDEEIRDMISEQEDKSQNDQAGYQLSFFLGDVLVALVMNPARDRKDKQRAEKAMNRLVEMSTTQVNRNAFGDALTDAMSPIYRKSAVLLKFCQAGGLGALIGDWVESTFKDTLCKDAIESLPNEAWNRQTPTSLDAVTRELLHKIEVEGDNIVETRLFANMMHQMYSRYGLAPFERASKISRSGIILFYFLYRRASKKRSKFTSVEDWTTLLQKYINVPRATRRRHGWMIMKVPERWECLDMYGCDYGECVEKAALIELRDNRQTGDRNSVTEDRLFRWGGISKACQRCRHVQYCGRDCQAADWPNHKAKCKEEAAKNKNEEV